MSAEGFTRTLFQRLIEQPSIAVKLAVEFEVPESTVMRWAVGSARPHPRIQTQVLAYLESIPPRTEP